jgi:hypothetical protein
VRANALRCPGDAIRVCVGSSSVVRVLGLAFTAERSGLPARFGPHCAPSRAGGWSDARKQHVSSCVPLNGRRAAGREIQRRFGSWCRWSATWFASARSERSISTRPGGSASNSRTSRPQGRSNVVLDLRGVTFLDSTGLHLALDADAASRARLEVRVDRRSGRCTARLRPHGGSAQGSRSSRHPSFAALLMAPGETPAWCARRPVLPTRPRVSGGASASAGPRARRPRGPAPVMLASTSARASDLFFLGVSVLRRGEEGTRLNSFYAS